MSDHAQSSALDVGSTIADTYRLTGLIGKGGMGTVFAAEHLRLPGRQVAIKVLNADVASDPDALARFEREAKVVSRLGHPNIVGIHDFNTLPSGNPYLVLELLHGETLDERLRGGPLPLELALHYLRQIGSALRKAHDNEVVHRDLKPHNIFIVRSEVDGQVTEVVKVLDFGISKIHGSQTIKTQTATVMGTPQYMSPEQAKGEHDLIDRRTDIFCLGMLAYEMLSGQPPFDGQNVPEVVFKIVYEPEKKLDDLVPGLPAHVTNAVAKAMAKSQDNRFATVREFVEALTGDVTQPEVMRPLFATGDDRTGSSMAMAKTVGSGSLPAPLTVTETSMAASPFKRPRLMAAVVVAVAAMGLVIYAVIPDSSGASGAKRQHSRPVVGDGEPTNAQRDSSKPAQAVDDPTADAPAPGDGRGVEEQAMADNAAAASDSKGNASAHTAATERNAADNAANNRGANNRAATDSDSKGNSAANSVATNSDSNSTAAAHNASTDSDSNGNSAANSMAANRDSKGNEASQVSPPIESERAKTLPSRVQSILSQAEAALRGGNYEAAMTAAKGLQGIEFPYSAQYVKSVRARAMCMRRQQALARPLYRQLRVPALRQKVQAFCANFGYHFPP